MVAAETILDKIRSLGWDVRVEQHDGATAVYATRVGEGSYSYSCAGDGPKALFHAACEVAECVGVELAG